MKSAPRHTNGDQAGLAVFGDLAALLANVLSALFSLTLFAAVATASYGRMMLLPAAASSDSGNGDLLARAVAAVDSAGIASGLARGILMLVLFVIAVLMLAAARTPVKIMLARVFAVFYMLLACFQLALGVAYFDNGPYELQPYAAVMSATLLFTAFTIVLGVSGNVASWFAYFVVPFVLVALMHIVMLVFSRQITLDVYFAGRLAVFFVIGFILIAYAYVGKLVDAIS
jgi:hypothetical protein